MIIRNTIFALSLLGLMAACGGPNESTDVPQAEPAGASSADIGDHVVHFSAQTTDQLPPDVARAYNIVRSPNRAMLNVSVLRADDNTPVEASVAVKTVNLTGQLKNVTMREITEPGDVLAIYYIGETPVANRETLFEIDVMYRANASVERVVEGIKRTLLARHGREDFTITTQEQMLDVLGSILNVLTFAVAAIGGISLLVGAIGIVTIMTIAVNERTGEIGLMRALGARQAQIMGLFLGEAAVLAAIGGLAGLVMGLGVASLLRLALPELPVHTPSIYVVLAEVLAVVLGIISGILPARRAARLDPVEALRDE